jgi:hypothetical protein
MNSHTSKRVGLGHSFVSNCLADSFFEEGLTRTIDGKLIKAVVLVVTCKLHLLRAVVRGGRGAYNYVTRLQTPYTLHVMAITHITSLAQLHAILDKSSAKLTVSLDNGLL